MTREEARKLIGGYATGSLSEAERKLLFEAALEDQELFDELAREQVLKETIEAPGARERLLRAVVPQESSPGGTLAAWWRRPWPWAGLAGTLAAAAIAWVVWVSPAVRAPQPVEVARSEAPAPPPAAAQTPASQVQEAQAPAAEPRAEPARKGGVESPAARTITGGAAKGGGGTRPQAPPGTARQESARRDAAPAAEPQQALAQPAEAAQRAAPAEKAAVPVNPAPEGALAAVTAAKESPPPPVPPPKPLAEAPKLAQAGNGGARAGFAADSVARRPVRFDYAVEDGALRIVPSVPGYLTVTANDSLVFPRNQVVPATPVVIPLPEAATVVAITFSVDQNPPEAPGEGVERRTDLRGTVTGADGGAAQVVVLLR